MKQQRGYLLLSLLIGCAILAIVMVYSYTNTSDTKENQIEQGNNAVDAATKAKLQLEQQQY